MASPPRTACHSAASALAICVASTPCVAAGGSVVDCLRAAIPPECASLHNAYVECRRSQLDMRTRIRGRNFTDYGGDGGGGGGEGGAAP